MLTFDEEVVERSESKSLFEHNISNLIKDNFRRQSIQSAI